MKAFVVFAVIVGVVGCGKGAAPDKAAGTGGAATGSAGSAGSAVAGSASGAAGVAGAGGSGDGSGSADSGSAASGGDVAVPSAAQLPGPTTDDAKLGANIALAVLGGHVVRPAATPEDDPAWKPANLIDGFPVIVGMEVTAKGWLAKDAGPQEVVIGFRGDKVASIASVVIDTASEGNVADPAGMPKDVEVQVSATSATDGFTSVAKAALPAIAGEHALRFAATNAKFVKVVVASTQGGAPAQLGEVQVYEAPAAMSIAADVSKNLLLPALGGHLVRFTSQAADGFAAEVIDGTTRLNGGWSSEPSPPEAPAQLPQEFVFAFRDRASVKIDRVVIDPTSGLGICAGCPSPYTPTWAKSVEVLTSDAPRDGFTLLTTIAVPAVAKPVSVPIGKAIRYLKLRIVENNGGDRVTLGEVEAFEAASGTSLINGRRPQLQTSVTTSAPASGAANSPLSFTREEREPNDTAAQADPLAPGDAVRGSATATDHDFFSVASTAPGPQSLTIGLQGVPAIRTRTTLRDSKGAVVLALEPSQLAVAPRTRVSVLAPAGPVSIDVEQPPSAQVVIWDTSGSMERRVADLGAALKAYLGRATPDDRIQLVRFDDVVEVVLKDFASQPAALVAALADKVYANGGTAIYDAIAKGIEVLSALSGNRAIVMLTDGADTASRLDPPRMWAAIDGGRTRVYTIGLGESLRVFVARAGSTAERTLADAAEMSGGSYMFIADSAQLTAMYTRIADELHAKATYAISATTSQAKGTLSVVAKGSITVPPRVELVLDASGSMKRAIGGKPMIDSAKAALTDVVARLPVGTQVALRVYGEKVADKAPGACNDSALVVPFASLDRKQITTTVKAVRALGTTPIATSIRLAGDDLRDPPGPAMLIVVTDGREECGGDPQAEIEKLRASGLDVTLNVIGFSLTDAADKAAMTKLATAGRGSFFDAKDEAALRSSIDRALSVPYDVIDAAGVVVAHGTTGGESIAVPEGDFTVRIASAGVPILVEHIPVTAGKASRVELTKDGDRVASHIVR